MTKYTDKATEFVQTLIGAHDSEESDITISTSWGSPLSDEKVVSEKLIKDTIDTKANSSGYTASQNLVTNSSGDIATESKPIIPQPSTTATDIKMNGTQSAGGLNTTTYAKADHVHPSDTNKQDLLVSGTNIQTINGQSILRSGDLSIGTEVGTFSDLNELINLSTLNRYTLVLDKDYKYDSTTDSSLSSGIEITQDIIIIGNGHIIDGNNYARAFIDTIGYTWELNDLKIQNCTSNNDNKYGYNVGGAIYADQYTHVNINNTTFTQNNAEDGGAIFADNSQININNTNINNNNANNGQGGAICTWNSQININNTNITHNNATNNGGAIFAYDNSQINITQSIIKNNTATNYANIYCNSATTVYNCDIDNIVTTCYNVTNYNYINETNIANNLTTTTSGKVLDARQGKALADLIGDAITYINQ